MTRYILSKLYKEGFYSYEFEKNNIYISWSKDDIDKVRSHKKKEKIKEVNLNNSKKEVKIDLQAFASKDKLKY